MDRWMFLGFGKRTFANGLLRSFSVPLFRVAILLIAVPIAVGGHTTWVSTVGVCLLVPSVVAEMTNFVVMAGVHLDCAETCRRRLS